MRTLPVLLGFLTLLLPACGGGGGSSGPGRALAARAPTSEEQLMEDAVHALINNERDAQGRSALAHDPVLREIARRHSQDMIQREYFDHDSPDGMSPFDRMAERGYSYRAAGENIAYNGGFSDPAAVAVNGWMNSDGHRRNILNTQFTHAGLGVARSERGTWFFTQVFALPYGNLVVMQVVPTRSVEDGRLNAGSSSWSVVEEH